MGRITWDPLLSKRTWACLLAMQGHLCPRGRGRSEPCDRPTLRRTHNMGDRRPEVECLPDNTLWGGVTAECGCSGFKCRRMGCVILSRGWASVSPQFLLGMRWATRNNRCSVGVHGMTANEASAASQSCTCLAGLTHAMCWLPARIKSPGSPSGFPVSQERHQFPCFRDYTQSGM